MKPAYLAGSLFAFAVGIGTALGINAYFTTKAELAAVKQSTVQTPVTTQSASTTPVVATIAAQPAPVQDFESLSLCDQLDAVAKSGKSVAQFIANSGRYSEFEANVRANCNWNNEQLQQAYAILNPPVITVQPRIVQQPVVVNPVVNPPKPVPGKPWNNCNGIPEPGETYSPACDQAQTDNDHNPNPHHHDPIDDRPIDPLTGERTDPDLPFDPNTGKNTGVKGYSFPSENFDPQIEQQAAPTPDVSAPAESQTVETYSDSAES